VTPICHACNERKAGAELHLMHKTAMVTGRTSPPNPRALAVETDTEKADRKQCGPRLCEPSTWSHVETAFFTVSTAHLPTSEDATGTCSVLHGDLLEPAFHALVSRLERGPRRLSLLTTLSGPPLATCTPCTSSGGCTELQILVEDDAVWGAVLRKDSVTHQVFQGTRLVLTLTADRDSESLLVKSDIGELLAVATHCPAGQLLELGVKSGADPVLLLLCVLGVIAFDLGQAVLPLPVL